MHATALAPLFGSTTQQLHLKMLNKIYELNPFHIKPPTTRVTVEPPFKI
jgi:hypothetical protein